MTQVQTCGAGLAQNSAIPAKTAEVIEALTQILETHVPTIDTSNEAGRLEREAYVSLARSYRIIAADLAATAARMAGFKSLPAAPHIESELADPQLFSTFETYVRREGELLHLLDAQVAADRRMLEAARDADRAGDADHAGDADQV